MALTNRRIDSGFKQKIKAKYNIHTKPSKDNMLVEGLTTKTANREKNKNPTLPNYRSNNVLFGGYEIATPPTPKQPYEGSLELIQ
jgi:hypothetical protein